MSTVLQVRDLSIDYQLAGGARSAVRGVSFSIGNGEALALVGESGSGKSTIARSILGLSAENARVAGGSITVVNKDILRLRPRELRALRGSVIGLVPQDPAVSLNPLRTVGSQLEECFVIAGETGDLRARAIELLAQVGLRDAAAVHAKFPHELSGGMNQRVLIAIAISRKPKLIIADEPTSGLDVTVQKRILDLIDELRRATGTAVLLVTHDLAVAADRTERVAIMSAGEIVEQGETRQVFLSPNHPYARDLVKAGKIQPSAAARTTAVGTDAPVLTVEGLVKDYEGSTQNGNRFRAVDNVSFTVPQGTTVSIVGESGSGKTTIASMISGLLAPTSGTIRFARSPSESLSAAGEPRRPGIVQFVFQNPYRSLNPRLSIEQVIGEPLEVLGVRDRGVRRQRVLEMLDLVSLPGSALVKRAGELSGGQCQRVAIARAVIGNPRLVILDEPLSALDVSVQEQILSLLHTLQQETGTSYLLISHDLKVVQRISQHVLVLKNGRVVEEGSPDDVLANPKDEFTRNLVSSIPGSTYLDLGLN